MTFYGKSPQEVLRMKKFKTFLMALINSVMILTGAVILGLFTRPLYYMFIPRILKENPQYTKELIKSNYDLLIDYYNPFYRGKLALDGLAMSDQGEFHFYEVKLIFNLIFIIFAVAFILSLIIYLFNRRESLGGYLKLTALMTFVIPFILSIPFIVDFSRSFVLFHEIAFSNDYWIFDPAIDPVIMILPEWFFMYAAFLILAFMAVLAGLFFALGKYLEKKNKHYYRPIFKTKMR